MKKLFPIFALIINKTQSQVFVDGAFNKGSKNDEGWTTNFTDKSQNHFTKNNANPNKPIYGGKNKCSGGMGSCRMSRFFEGFKKSYYYTTVWADFYVYKKPGRQLTQSLYCLAAGRQLMRWYFPHDKGQKRGNLFYKRLKFTWNNVDKKIKFDVFSDDTGIFYGINNIKFCQCKPIQLDKKREHCNCKPKNEEPAEKKIQKVEQPVVQKKLDKKIYSKQADTREIIRSESTPSASTPTPTPSPSTPTPSPSTPTPSPSSKTTASTPTSSSPSTVKQRIRTQQKIQKSIRKKEKLQPHRPSDDESQHEGEQYSEEIQQKFVEVPCDPDNSSASLGTVIIQGKEDKEVYCNKYTKTIIGQQCAVLFDQPSYQGEHFVLCGKEPIFEQVGWSTKRTKSVYLYETFGGTVDLFDRTHFNGKKYEFTKSDPNVSFQDTEFLAKSFHIHRKIIPILKSQI